MAETGQGTQNNTETMVREILATIDREREQEIIGRRFGLFDRKETLEQIGEMLGITRERVRQLEKSVLIKLRQSAEKGNLPHINDFQSLIISKLEGSGDASRIKVIANEITGSTDREEQSRIAFLCQLCSKLSFIAEDDNYYSGIAIAKVYSESSIKKEINNLIEVIKGLKEPLPIEEIAKSANIDQPVKAAALASFSKKLATLNGRWGLTKWPLVNPKNIRDKIYVILKENGKQMHFNEIAEAIKDSDFKRKDVTTQAIHNELIKDSRFVLIGRGIYALKEWGYKKGTVADMITEVLKEASEPLHRDEIVKRVLKSRFVKETTILLNLQGKDQFKRVAKATYTLEEQPAISSQ